MKAKNPPRFRLRRKAAELLFAGPAASGANTRGTRKNKIKSEIREWTESIIIALILALVVLFTIALFYQEFVYITFDAESAKVSGVRVRRLDSLMAMLTAVTVVLGMKVVGILLVSALLVIPAAAALQVARSFKEALVVSASLAGISALGGLIMAFYLDWPASGTIVAVSGLLFLILFQMRPYRKTTGEELS